MAQSYIDKYVFALMLDSSNFEKGANLATKAANGIKSTLLKTYTALGGIDLFKNMLTDYTSAAHSIDMMNTLTGESLVQMQAWEKTIQDTGGNVGAFRNSLRGLNDSLAQFKNFGQVDNKIVALFRQGISPTDAMGNWKKGTEVLKDAAKIVRNIKDESSAWTWANMMGIDESTFRMMRIHGEQLDDIIKKNEKYAIIKKADIETNRQYDLMVSEFKTSWLELSKTIMGTLLPVIQKELFPAIKNVMDYFRENKGGIIESIKTISDLILKAAEGFKAVGEGLGIAAAEIVTTQGQNVEQYGKGLGTAKTVGGLALDAMQPLAKVNLPYYLMGKAQSYILNINKVEVNADNAEDFTASMQNEAAKYTNDLSINAGTGQNSL